MLVTIHNLPSNTRYCDVKSLIESKCGLSGVILDNLVNEGNRKKVTIGVVEEEDAAIIVRKINGLYLSGMQLYVEDVRQKKASEQPYRSNVNLLQEAQSKYQQPIAQTPMNQNSTPTMVPPPNTNYDMGMPAMYYMPMGQTPYMNYGQTQPVMSEYSEYPVNSESTLGLGNSNVTNSVWQTQQSDWEQSNGSKRSYNDQQYSDPNVEQYDRGQESGRHDNSSRWTTDNIQCDNTRKRKSSPPRDSWSPIHQTSDSLWQHNQEIPLHQSQNVMNQYNKSFESNSIQSYSGFSGNAFGSHATEFNSREQDKQRASRWDSRDIPRPKERDSSNLGKSKPSNQRDTAPPFQRGPINNSKQSNYCPPAKRFKDDNDRFKGGSSTTHPNDNRAATSSQNSFKGSNYLKKMFQKDCNWRCQAASIITNQILMNRGPKVNPSIPDDLITERIKRTVRSRMHILTGYKVQVNVAHLISLYRGPFNAFDDQNLYEFVLERLERELECGDEHNDGTGINKETRKKQQVIAPGSMATASMEGRVTKLPKYIEGNKKLSKQQKHFSRMDFVTTNEDLVLDPKVEAALNDELEIVKKLVLEGCSDPQGDAEQMFCKRFNKLSLLEDMMRIIKVNLSKRMCGERCTPALRIYGHPKPPKKAALEHYLTGRGVLSLKKAEKKPFFIATCDSYDSLDKLCAQEIITICGIETLFKPMYLTGIPPKILKKLEKKHAAKKGLQSNEKETENQSNIEGSDDNGSGESTVHNKPQTEEVQITTDPDKAQNDQEEQGFNKEPHKNLIAQKIEENTDITVVKSNTVESITDQKIPEGNDSLTQVIPEENVTEIQKDGNGIQENQNTEDIETKNEEREILENQNPGDKEVKNELEGSNNAQKQTVTNKSDVIEEGLVVGQESKDTENGIKDNNQNADENGDVATVNNNIENKETENVSATEYLSPEQSSLNFEDFAVIDEVTGDDVGSDKEGDNVKFASNIEIPDIDQVDENDLEDY